MNTEWLDFEIEAESIDDAKKKITELQEAFGTDVCIKVIFVSGNKDKVLTTLDDGMKKLFKDISKKLGGKENGIC